MNGDASAYVLRPDDALVIVDVQKDFLPGGALPVPNGQEVVPALNTYIGYFCAEGLPVFATRHWRPRGHCSFKTAGGPWPQHCVAGTAGAAFAPDLAVPPDAYIISRGADANAEEYSGFAGSNLADCLRDQGARRLFIGGLTTDYGVLDTVRDALVQRFEVVVLLDAVRAVNVTPRDGLAAVAQMKRMGAATAEINQVIEPATAAR